MMKTIRILCFLLAVLMAERATAQVVYDPTDPIESNDPYEGVSQVDLETGYAFPVYLTHFTNENDNHPSNYSYKLNVTDTLTVHFLCSFSYDDGGTGQLMPQKVIPLRIDLYKRTEGGTDSLFKHLPYRVNGMTERAILDTLAYGNDTCMIPPGTYRLQYLGYLEDGDIFLPDALQPMSMRGEEAAVAENVEMLAGHSKVKVTMECLPLLIERVLTWNHVDTYASRDGSKHGGSRTVEFFDDFGKPELTYRVGYSPLGSDHVTLQEYDNWGRKGRQWLPAVYADSLFSGEHTHADTCQQWIGDTYAGESHPYGYPVYEKTPLGRILSEYGAGWSWQWVRRAVHTAYFNSMAGNDTLNCLKLDFSVSSIYDITVTSAGNFPTGALQVTRTQDEDGKTVFEFRDGEDRVVMTRSILRKGKTSRDKLDTYYLYDGLGRLRVVLPPLAVAGISGNSLPTSVMDSYAYLYNYDDRDRLIMKKLPGAEWVYMVYDEADRLVFSQDGEQRSRGEATFHLYDIFGRESVTGTCMRTIDRGSSIGKIVLSRYTGGLADLQGYVSDSISLSSPKVLTAVYYDTYDFAADLQTGLPVDTLKYHRTASHAQGLQTGTATAVLDGGGSTAYLYSVIRYDRRNRAARTESTNLLGGTDVEDTEYSFRGMPLQRHHVHTAAGKPAVTEHYDYTYDHEDRLLTATHTLNGGTPMLLSGNEYDELGRLVRTTKGAGRPIVTGYRYNIRSWVDSIGNDRFTEKIYYNTKSSSTAAACYNGSISSIEWTAADNPAKTRGYEYRYDGMNRLTAAGYTENGSPSSKFSTSYSYDWHGNVLSLSRHGNLTASTYGQVDDLSMEYDGNQLVSVQDGGQSSAHANSMDFRDGASGQAEYAYDGNGNLLSDQNKGISLEYNVLNLPVKVTSSGGTAEYSYSALGEKLRRTVTSGSTAVTTDYAGNIVYRNGTRRYILFEGGYIQGSYYYFYERDHLGNNRAVVQGHNAPAGQAVQVLHYYPYGAVFAEGVGTASSGQPYRYNGKELESDNGLNLYDYGARYQDPQLGRFISIDPLCEENYSVSPYHYANNNPINRIDLFGLFDDWVQNKKDGTYTWMDDVTSTDNTPNGYIYVGKDNDDILTNLNIPTNFPIQRDYGYSVGVDGDDKIRTGTLVARATELQGSISAIADVSYSLRNATANNSMGKVFNGVLFKANLIQKNIEGEVNYSNSYKGTFTINRVKGYKSEQAVFKAPIEPVVFEKGTQVTSASIKIPQNVIKNHSFGPAVISVGLTSNNFIITKPIKMTWDLRFNPLLLQK